jgi:hypothetical protein
MNIIKINRTITIEIEDESVSSTYNIEADEEYKKFLKIIQRQHSTLMKDIYLQLKGREVLKL